MSKEAFAGKMRQYIPEQAINTVYGWLEPHRIKLRITKPRSTKLGDFRLKSAHHPPAISVNGNLNPYAFLVTLTHEVAHLKDFEERKNLQNPHGKHWKRIYSGLLHEVMNTGAFPRALHTALEQHIANPRAASCSDPVLLDALRQYDEVLLPRLKDLSEGERFSLSGGRVFELGERRRTRYKCRELTTGKWYLVHGEAEVVPLSAS